MAEPLPSQPSDLPTPPDAAPAARVQVKASALSSALKRGEAVAVLAAALLSVVFYLRLPSALPAESDYRAAAARIEAQRRPGDAVLLDPHWAERARLYFDGLPVLNLGRTPTREDLERYPRLFVLSLPELPRSDREATFAFLERGGFRRLGELEHFGPLSVALFENARPQTPSFDFTSRVAEARVYIRRPDGSEEMCPLVGERHPCPRAGWINVGAELKEIAFKPYRCLWAHPAGRDPLVVEYSGVTLGKELRLLAGIVGQIAYRHERYAPVLLEVKVDGELLTALSVPPGEPGERRRAIDTSRLAGTQHTVQFEISATNPDMRHFCFDAGVYP